MKKDVKAKLQFSQFPELLSGLIAATTEGFKASVGILKVMLPVSLGVMLLEYFGVVGILSHVLSPFFGSFGLPGEAALALISGYVINCYSAFAVIATLSLTGKEVTILSVMLLLCHTLPVELSVQKKAGGQFWLILAIRIGSSLLSGLILNYLIPESTQVLTLRLPVHSTIKMLSFDKILMAWFFENTVILKIILVNIAVIIFYSLLKYFNIIAKVTHFFKPLMRFLGLPKESAFLWIVANTLGLIAGAAMLVEAKNNQSLDETSLKQLNISLATCHALIQETANFCAIGAWLPFLILPRIVVSLISTWGYLFLGMFLGKRCRQNPLEVSQ